ncbi:MAG: hypothetical protein R3C40_07445 [Parvularculaceae bacterium]
MTQNTPGAVNDFRVTEGDFHHDRPGGSAMDADRQRPVLRIVDARL